MDNHNLTYDDLKKLLQQRLSADDKTPETVKPNIRSALNGFMSERGFKDTDVVGSTLRASYYRSRDLHLAALLEQGRPREYLANRQRLLAYVRRVLLDADRVAAAKAGARAPFHDAIQRLFAEGAPVKPTARACHVPLATLRRWMNGHVPNVRSAQWIPRLERHFALPPGALSDLLPYRTVKKASAANKPETIEYRVRLKASRSLPFALKAPSDSLRAEWADFVAYKTAYGTAGSGQKRRSRTGRWSRTTAPVEKRRATNWHSFSGPFYVASASIAWNFVGNFLGWLMLPRASGGLELPSTDAQTLANFAREEYVRQYIDWSIARSNGIIHGGIERTLKLVSSLTHPETGYLTQACPELAAKAGAHSMADWEAMCRHAHGYAKSMLADISSELRPSRDSFAPIQHVLSLPNPLDAIADAVLRMTADRPTVGGQAEAIWMRDRLLFKLLASNPLRDKNVRLMTYRPDGSGHLRKVDGEWRICIPRGEFKNAAGAAKDRDYNMPLRPEVAADIERYLSTYRPILASASNPYLFVSSERPDGPMYGLRRRFEVLSRRYIAECPGAGPHAMRHIVATSILKQRPNDWAAAAWALHDREETVRKHYAHLRSNDAAQWFGPAMAGPFSRM